MTDAIATQRRVSSLSGIASVCIAAAVMCIGVIPWGCKMAVTEGQAGISRQATLPGREIQPGLGLKTIRISDPGIRASVNVPETAAIRAAECLFNHASDAAIPNFNGCDKIISKGKPLSARIKSTRADTAGNRHLRTTQWYRGVRVVGAEIIFHMDKGGNIYRINGRYLPPLEIVVRPAIDKREALSIGMQQFPDGSDLKVAQAPELVIYGKRLSYHYIISDQGAGGGQWVNYVDALTGEMMFRYNNLQTN